MKRQNILSASPGTGIRCISVGICLVLFAMLTGCSPAEKKYTAEFYGTFDTYISFTAYAKNEREFKEYSEIVRGELERLHKLFDIYNDYDGMANLKTVNDNAGISPVKMDASAIDLLEHAVSAYRYTDGAVNVALGPMLKIWHDCRARASQNPEAAELPSYEDLREAAKLAVIEDVVIDRAGSAVFLRRKGMSLDVGAIAKGYAAQKSMELAKQAGMASGLLNAGGNVCAVGKPKDGRDAWSVAVRSPETDDEYFATIGASDVSVVSSGDYERFYTVGGVRLHHIIDPVTLYPAESARAVTVIHPDSTIADALSTAAFILPYERARRIVEQMGGEAVWITPDGGSYSTKGFERYITDRSP